MIVVTGKGARAARDDGLARRTRRVAPPRAALAARARPARGRARLRGGRPRPTAAPARSMCGCAGASGAERGGERSAFDLAARDAPEARGNPRGALFTMTESVDVLGLGNRWSTSSPQTDDAFLVGAGHGQGRDDADRRGARRGALRRARRAAAIVSGGSAANTIVGVASFGVSAPISARSSTIRSARPSRATSARPASRFDTAPGRRTARRPGAASSTSRPTASGR